MNSVQVHGIRSYAFHGCLKEETKIGGNYITNIDVFFDFKRASENDDLSKTVDYVDIKEIVEIEMQNSSKLIETVGYRIINRIKLKFSEVKSCKIQIKKINPPINGDVDFVAVIIEE